MPATFLLRLALGAERLDRLNCFGFSALARSPTLPAMVIGGRKRAGEAFRRFAVVDDAWPVATPSFEIAALSIPASHTLQANQTDRL